jgi:hypothetical protein
MGQTVVQSLVANLQAMAKVNASVQAKPDAILWTDSDSQWLTLIPLLKLEGLAILILGKYDQPNLTGPSIWIKSAISGLIDGVDFGNEVPIIYMPGIGRSDLRAIETCPRDLQPLAELQFRGVFWSQANGKDWTLNAFLSSKINGLGLTVTQDKATFEALTRVFEAGALWDRSIDDLRGKNIDSNWLDSLLSPNPIRDLLLWLNKPNEMKKLWGEAKWKVFIKHCQSDFQFHPESDGVLIAAEKMASQKGSWKSVWELYSDSFTSFPNIIDVLTKIQPPNKELFDVWDTFQGYPQANIQAEDKLRKSLLSLDGLVPQEIRNQIIELENEHGARRNWLWNKMGRSPLTNSLEHLNKLSEISRKAIIGKNLEQLASEYEGYGYKVDLLVLNAIAETQSNADLEAVSSVIRGLYLPWVSEGAFNFQDCLKNAGGLPDKVKDKNNSSALCTVFIDGLRYDVATLLKDKLSIFGASKLHSEWTSMPSVTSSGKAWCSPVAELIGGNQDDKDFEPRVKADNKPLSAHNFRKLLADNNIQHLTKHEVGDPTGRAWVECGDLDHYGHEHGTRLARDIDVQLKIVIERVEELIAAGWKKFKFVTDHGWLLMPGGLPKSDLQKHQAETRWGRCAVLKISAEGTPLTFGWSWCKDVQIAFAPGVSSFISGAEYAHGGLTLQECLVPIISLEVKELSLVDTTLEILKITWKGLRCSIEVATSEMNLFADIRIKPLVASSSLASSAKPLELNKVSLIVENDEYLGSAAIVVILDKDGNLVQKIATTIGG